MIELKKGYISITKQNYNYELLDGHTLINYMKTKKNLMMSFENILRKYRNNPLFQLLKIIQEEINIHPEDTLYLIIYKKDEVISCARLNIKNNYCYLNMIVVNEKYRRMGLCTKIINKCILLTKNHVKKYALDVEKENKHAIKCYENNGFAIIKKTKKCNTDIYIMELHI